VVQAAFGWLELGLPAEARAELAALTAAHAAHPRASACRLALASHEEAWAEAREWAEHLVMLQPDEPQWTISLAYATRRARSLPEAEAILRAARARFPREAVLPYNLACYAAQLGRLDEARTLLAEATALDESVMDLAAQDPDLLPLRLRE
jgi:predicted Zn-dependent protease